MTVYAVFQTAVYRHDCDGIFSTLERAREVADTCALAGDGHHAYKVIPFEVDVACPFIHEDNTQEAGWLYSVQRKRQNSDELIRQLPSSGIEALKGVPTGE